MLKPPRIFTLVQNWLGLTRFETDQVLAVMFEHEDLDGMTDDDLRALSEEAMECLIQEKTLGRAALYQP